jgi:hypothetical protein
MSTGLESLGLEPRDVQLNCGLQTSQVLAFDREFDDL